jgi:hypothetical protein
MFHDVGTWTPGLASQRKVNIGALLLCLAAASRAGTIIYSGAGSGYGLGLKTENISIISIIFIKLIPTIYI